MTEAIPNQKRFQGRQSGSASGRGNNGALARALEQTLRGDVKFDDGYRALYATDASNYRQVPIGVAFPADKEDVVAGGAAGS